VISEPTNPGSPTHFYITEDGKIPTLFDVNNAPAVTTQQGAIEDWIIENRFTEIHAFHIHQLHFLLLEKMAYRLRMTSDNYWTEFKFLTGPAGAPIRV